ncbi:NIC-domain-containing protein [Meira miltonrushii]|uniref:Nuclear pore protein n=1 Tax=Meira miltonrushii TaxID=1280837 RepID=A0A316VG22_9BASI|nr:NIC-domain-containing protein [Meira miltonrushii]PWN36577.1 NIC-domain-containing protein [Meira miltonrushii]
MGGEKTLSLTELLQQSRQLNAQLGSRADLPNIHLGLDQIEAQSRKIAQTRATPFALGANNDSKAHYFLANGGIDASGLADTINQTNIANAFEPLQPMSDTDVDSYLRHSREQIILSAIEESRRETMADFHRNLAKAQTRDWEAQKVRILEELGQHTHYGGGQQSSSRLGMSTSRNFSQSSGITVGGARSGKYLAVVERLNAHRIDSVPFAIASALGEAARSSLTAPASGVDSTFSQDLYESWLALASLVGEENVVDGEFLRDAIRERQYAAAYLGNASSTAAAWLGREGRDLRTCLTSGALKYLQKYFNNLIDARIASNPIKAQLGGKPTTLGKIVAFERVAFADRDGRWPSELEVIQTEHGSTPVWATIFYLLSTGNEKEALEFVIKNEDAIRSLDSTTGGAGGFSSYFQAWLGNADHILSKPIRDRFVTEYNSRFRGTFGGDTIDGFKLTLFKLIGRIDINKNFPSVVSKDTETWLWVQLNLVRETTVEEASSEFGDALRDRLTLEDLGSRVVKLGERHFDPKNNRPIHYFTILLLSGQFERAIAHLYSRSQYQVDAVNFASALTYYGLLRVPSLEKASHAMILTSTVDATTGQEIMMLDFAKLIQKYVRLFSRTDVKGALQYIYLICLNADCASPIKEEQIAKCHELIRALVIETRQYFELLGDVRNDGVKTPGVIENSLSLIKLADSKEFLTNIVGAAAAQSEAENRTKDAILLYNIAEEYDRVLDVVNRQLGVSLIEPPTRASQETISPDSSLTKVDDIAQLAKAILQSYERQNQILRLVSRKKRETCQTLLTLKECFDLFSRNELEKSLSTIESLDLIPLHGDMVTITRKAESFKDVDEGIAKNLSEILLLVMNCISKLYQTLKSSPFGDSNRHQRLADYRSMARGLMLFAGMLRLRIEPSTFAQLTRLDVYLH